MHLRLVYTALFNSSHDVTFQHHRIIPPSMDRTPMELFCWGASVLVIPGPVRTVVQMINVQWYQMRACLTDRLSCMCFLWRETDGQTADGEIWRGRCVDWWMVSVRSSRSLWRPEPLHTLVGLLIAPSVCLSVACLLLTPWLKKTLKNKHNRNSCNFWTGFDMRSQNGRKIVRNLKLTVVYA